MEAMVEAEAVVVAGVVGVAEVAGAGSAPFGAGVVFRDHPVDVVLVLAAVAVVLVVLVAGEMVNEAAFSKMYSLSSTIL